MSRRRSNSNQKSRPSGSHSAYIYEKGFDQQHRQFSIPYQLGQELGKGGFAQCYSIKVAGENHLFAAKVFSKHSDRSRNLEKINNEIEIMSGLRHEGIVRFYRKFETEDHIYMIMERCCQGSLSDVIKNRGYLSEPEVRYLVSQLVPILCYLKESNVIHRDIKMGNIMFDDKFRVKLGDFGLSTYTSNHLLKKNICGTPNYIAPEVINRQSYGCQVDVWSTGILIHTLLLGKPPFEAKTVPQTYEIILKCALTFEPITDQISISSYAVSFLKRLIEKDRSKRIKLEEIMQHPFMALFQIPQQLELTFPFRCPSKIFMKRYGNKKNPLQSCSFSSSKEISEPGETYKSYALSAEKIEFLRNLSEQSIEKTEQAQQILKREFSEEQIQQYFSNVAKRFKTNVSTVIETRTNRKRKLQMEQLVDKLKQICQNKPILPLDKIKEMLRLPDESSESKKPYNFYSLVRVIYLRKDTNLSYTVYLTNYYLMGLIFDDQSSIIHHLYYKKTFYLQHQNISQTTELSSDIVADHYQGQFKSKLNRFSEQQKIVKQLIRKDNYIRNSTSASLDLYHAFCFVNDIHCGKHCKIISFTNGDITLFKNEAEAFAISAEKQTIELYCQGTQKAKLHIDRICQLPEGYCDKLKRYCRTLFEMPMRAISISGKKEKKLQEKDGCLVQPIASGVNICSK